MLEVNPLSLGTVKYLHSSQAKIPSSLDPSCHGKGGRDEGNGKLASWENTVCTTKITDRTFISSAITLQPEKITYINVCFGN